jgi:hypothetical protein
MVLSVVWRIEEVATMSKTECLTYLQSHPGKHTTPEIAMRTGQNVETTRQLLVRLHKDKAVQAEYPARANLPIMWSA